MDEVGGSVTLAASDNGGSSWSDLQTYTLNASDGSQLHQSFDLTPYIASNTQIRFRTSGAELDALLYVDNVQIEAY